MGVPSEKASSAAASILSEAEYLQQLDPVDIYCSTADDICRAINILNGVLEAYSEVTSYSSFNVDRGE